MMGLSVLTDYRRPCRFCGALTVIWVGQRPVCGGCVASLLTAGASEAESTSRGRNVP